MVRGTTTEHPCAGGGCAPACRASPESPAPDARPTRAGRADWSVVPLSGELDLATGPRIRTCLDRHISAGRCRIVVDLSDVTFMDCTTLGLLVRARNAAKARGGTVRLVARHPQVLMLLDMTGMRRSFEVLPTRGAALAD